MGIMPPGPGGSSGALEAVPEWRLTGQFADALTPTQEQRLERTHNVFAVNLHPQEQRGLQEVSADVASAFRGLDSGVTPGAAPPIASALWAPGTAFGARHQADALVGKAALLAHAPPLRGKGVNVVVVDQGFDKRRFPNADFGGGWGRSGQAPGEGTSEHAAMIVRNVLDLAPDARIFDCPLIPAAVPGLAPSIANIPAFLDDAVALWDEILFVLWLIRTLDVDTGPWVFVNPWSVYDRRSEDPLGSYTENRGHWFNQQIQDTIDGGADVVFAAGNCGSFGPDRRCGPGDRGPCRSIWGANSLNDALTVGAVRVDAAWLGYSSQGPGQEALGRDKPDLCAPSQFAEDNDAAAVTSGTSGAVGVVGGAVAALRGKWDSAAMKPPALKAHLAGTARQAIGTGWNERSGHGILDLAAALA